MKPGCAAATAVRAKSIPAALNSARAASFCSQPSIAARPAFASAACQFELRAAPGGLNRIPAVAHCRRIVDQQHALRALPRGLLDLVGIAAVFGHGVAFEHRGIFRGIARIVRQHHHRLAVNIEIRVVIPRIFRRDDAVADEYHFAVRHIDFRHRALGPNDHILAEHQIAAAAWRRDGQRRIGAGGDLHQRHLLHVARAIAGLQTQLVKILDQVADRLVFSGRSRFAALKIIGGQHADVIAVGRCRRCRCEGGGSLGCIDAAGQEARDGQNQQKAPNSS